MDDDTDYTLAVDFVNYLLTEVEPEDQPGEQDETEAETPDEVIDLPVLDEVVIEEPVLPVLTAQEMVFVDEFDFAQRAHAGIPGAPAWWDGQTEVPEGYLWPWQVAELAAQVEYDAFQFTPEWYAEVMGIFGHVGAAIEVV